MYCKICGDENGIRYYPAKRQSLCPYCAKKTPAKVDKETFKNKYFGDESVNNWTLASFYEDYLASEHTLSQYIDATTSMG